MTRDRPWPAGPSPPNLTQRRIKRPYSESTRSWDQVAFANMRPSPNIMMFRLALVIATFSRLASSTKP
eukprot:4836130-Pyramimonas_sp.AAC.1